MEFTFRFNGPAAPPFTHVNAATHVSLTFSAVADGWRVAVPLPAPMYVVREALAVAGARGLVLAAEDQGWAVRWDAANRGAAAQQTAAGEPPAYCPRPVADYWYDYTCARQGLRLTWPSDAIAMAELRWWVRRSTRRAFLVAVLAEEWNSAILPEAEYAVIKRTRLPLPGVNPAPAGGAFIPFADVAAALGERLRRFETPVPHFLYRGGDGHSLWIRRLRNLPGVPHTEFGPIRHDRLVDVQ